MFEVVVDKDKCTGCEECVNACPAQVFEIEDGKSEPVEMIALGVSLPCGK